MNRPAVTVGITTLDDLREHLQWAIELEHATLPPYLCALYSLDPRTNPEAAGVVAGVFIEEMLHLALAANLLNAVGGRPRLDAPEVMRPYPRRLPHGDRSLELSLLPFGPEALEMFLRLELPAPPDGRAEADRYETIGQFYQAIEDGLRRLSAELGEKELFSGDPARQVHAGPSARPPAAWSWSTTWRRGSPRWRRSSSKARERAGVRSGTATRTSTTPTGTRSRTTTASRSSSWGGATGAVTRHVPARPARRSRPTSRTSFR